MKIPYNISWMQTQNVFLKNIAANQSRSIAANQSVNSRKAPKSSTLATEQETAPPITAFPLQLRDGRHPNQGAPIRLNRLTLSEREKYEASNNVERVSTGSAFGEYKKDYTKQDALNSKNTKVIDLKAPPGEANYISQPYAQDGLTNGADISWAGMSGVSGRTDVLHESIDYIASRYVAIKERVTNEFNGAELQENLSKIEQMFANQMEDLANNFASEVNGVLEENGVFGERELLYKSVLTHLESRISVYSKYAEANSGYADIGEDTWLKKDSAYMASELRKSMASSTTADVASEQEENSLYSVDELVKLKAFTKELESYSKDTEFNRYDGSSSPNKIHIGEETEESLGMKLGILALKGEVLNGSGVSERIKNAVSKSIGNFTSKTIAKQQAYMDKWSALQIANNGGPSEIARIKKNFAAVDIDAVYKVINKMKDDYKESGDASKAILDGVAYAKNISDQKSADKKYDGVQRYDQKAIWNIFYKRRDADYYMDTRSGLDKTIDSWNKFTSDIGLSGSASLKRPEFSTRA